MNPHLSEFELNASLWEEPSGSVAGHLASCADCRRERDLIAAPLAAFRDDSQQLAARDEFFWSAQRARIESQIAARSSQGIPGLAWSMVVGLIVLGVFLLKPAKPPAVPAPTYSQSIRSQDQDFALLVEVEHTVNSQVPDALAPATLLAYEMNRTALTKSK
ncbi:MAG TPA: hypothetical protein VEG30_15790 [Terriglobales bacterium]|nr:hypothetical protein [Terriglobales bacterium]